MTRFTVTTDPEHGGRWTTLTDPTGRQWLWDRPDPARNRVRPGDSFVDVGGIEECFPTLGSRPDHGELWSRPWTTLEDGTDHIIHEIMVGATKLRRAIGCDSGGVTVDYRLKAEPGTRFIWAAHALLQLNVGARIVAKAGVARVWPDHHELIETSWPRPLGIAYDRLPVDDGTAMFCLLPGRETVCVVDGDARLRFRLTSPGQPVSVGLWRNLGGYPWDAETKYRNIGIEPMLGNVFDIDAAAPSDLATVPDSGVVRWTLRVDNG